jgi:hypothetical protein
LWDFVRHPDNLTLTCGLENAPSFQSLSQQGTTLVLSSSPTSSGSFTAILRCTDPYGSSATVQLHTTVQDSSPAAPAPVYPTDPAQPLPALAVQTRVPFERTVNVSGARCPAPAAAVWTLAGAGGLNALSLTAAAAASPGLYTLRGVALSAGATTVSLRVSCDTAPALNRTLPLTLSASDAPTSALGPRCYGADRVQLPGDQESVTLGLGALDAALSAMPACVLEARPAAAALNTPAVDATRPLVRVEVSVAACAVAAGNFTLEEIGTGVQRACLAASVLEDLFVVCGSAALI